MTVQPRAPVLKLPIRCPECGTLTFPDDPGFPRCSQCHEDLLRCPWCHHHNGQTCTHRHATAWYAPEGEAAKRCPFFDSRHTIRPSRIAGTLPAPVWVLGILAVIMGGLMVSIWFVDPSWMRFAGQPVRLETIMPAEAIIGKPFTVTLRMTNRWHHPTHRVTIEIGDEVLAAATPGMPTPIPTRMSYTARRLLLEYSPPATNRVWELQLPFTPQVRGRVIFSARIWAPRDQLRQLIRTEFTIREAPSRLSEPVAPTSGPIEGATDDSVEGRSPHGY
jgi:hypothetical protein